MAFAQLKTSISYALSILFKFKNYGYCEQKAVKDIDFANPEFYYFDIRTKINYPGPFDKDGVMKVIYDKEEGEIYDPLMVINYGISAYQNYIITKERKYFEIALKQAEWLVKSQSSTMEYDGIWLNHHSYSIREMAKDWVSAIVQGKGISFMLRMWKLTGDVKFLDASKAAFKSIKKTTEQGGLKVYFKECLIWEEYTTTEPSMVLNGHIYCMLGVRDIYVYTGDEEAKKLWDESVSGIIKLLPDFDNGYWSRYELGFNGKNIASSFYHNFHIEQLEILFKITGNKVINDFKNRFQLYSDSRINSSRAFLTKVYWRLGHL